MRRRRRWSVGPGVTCPDCGVELARLTTAHRKTRWHLAVTEPKRLRAMDWQPLTGSEHANRQTVERYGIPHEVVPTKRTFYVVWVPEAWADLLNLRLDASAVRYRIETAELRGRLDKLKSETNHLYADLTTARHTIETEVENLVSRFVAAQLAGEWPSDLRQKYRHLKALITEQYMTEGTGGKL